MDVVQLQGEFTNQVKALFAEGMLDNQFKVIQGWTTEEVGDPSLAINAINHYLSMSEIGLNNMSNALEKPPDVDFKQLSVYAHQIKGPSFWIGARKVINLCLELQRCCAENILEGCLSCQAALKHEVAILNVKLQAVVKLEQDIMEANGRVPPVLD